MDNHDYVHILNCREVTVNSLTILYHKTEIRRIAALKMFLFIAEAIHEIFSIFNDIAIHITISFREDSNITLITHM